LAGEVNFALYQ